MDKHRPASSRNIAIFIAGVLLLGNLFGFYFYALDGLGGLGFILSPALLAFGLRAFAGDGWGDSGFGLHLRDNLVVYGVAILLFPVLLGFATGLGVLTGNVTFLSGAAVSMFKTMAASLPIIFLFAFFEEVGWRGYLEPRLSALGVPALRRHLFVALIWMPWHLGYILSHPEDHGHLPMPLLLILTLIATAAMAVIYGSARLLTASIWPAVIMHTIGNSLAWAMNDSPAVSVNAPLIYAARPDSLLVLTGLLVVALFALRWETRRAE